MVMYGLGHSVDLKVVESRESRIRDLGFSLNLGFGEVGNLERHEATGIRLAGGFARVHVSSQ